MHACTSHRSLGAALSPKSVGKDPVKPCQPTTPRATSSCQPALLAHAAAATSSVDSVATPNLFPPALAGKPRLDQPQNFSQQSDADTVLTPRSAPFFGPRAGSSSCSSGESFVKVAHSVAAFPCQAVKAAAQLQSSDARVESRDEVCFASPGQSRKLSYPASPGQSAQSTDSVSTALPQTSGFSRSRSVMGCLVSVCWSACRSCWVTSKTQNYLVAQGQVRQGKRYMQALQHYV